MAVSQEAPSSAVCEEEIDLRELVEILWRKRWLIVGVTVGLAIVAWLVSMWVLPRRYQASAYLVLHPWPTRTGEDLPLPAPPTVDTLITLAQSDAVFRRLEQAAKDRGQELEISQPQAVAINQEAMRLSVTASDPDDAAWLANSWAEIISEEINDIYGLDALETHLKVEQQNAYQVYEEKQQAYVEALQNEQRITWQMELDKANKELECLVSHQRDLPGLLEAVQKLRAHWEDLPADAPVPVQEGLLLMSLSQKGWQLGMCSSVSVPVQMQISSQGIPLNVTQGLASLDAVDSLLQEREEAMAARRTALEKQIIGLKATLNSENAHLNELQRARDEAWTRYQRAAKVWYTLKVFGFSDRPLVEKNLPAIAPKSPSSPRPLLNAALAGVIGLISSALAVLIWSWWRQEEPVGA